MSIGLIFNAAGVTQAQYDQVLNELHPDKKVPSGMDGLPVTIRLLDPPLHEFLPDEEHAADERM